MVQIDRKDLYKGKPEKALTEGLNKTGGRNNMGRMTARHIGGGHKRRYRIIDWKRKNGMLKAQLSALNMIQTAQLSSL